MRRLGIILMAATALTLTACGASSPWADKARAYVETIDATDPAKTIAYLEMACANPNLSPLDLTEKVGSWADVHGGTFSQLSEALRTVCPEQYPD